MTIPLPTVAVVLLGLCTAVDGVRVPVAGLRTCPIAMNMNAPLDVDRAVYLSKIAKEPAWLTDAPPAPDGGTTASAASAAAKMPPPKCQQNAKAAWLAVQTVPSHSLTSSS